MGTDWLGRKTGIDAGGARRGWTDVPLPPPQVRQSEVKSTVTASYNTDIDGIPTHRYPINIDNLNGANDVPMVQECIHFTAVQQGGISLQNKADNSQAIAKEEQQPQPSGNTHNMTRESGAAAAEAYSKGNLNKAAEINNKQAAKGERAVGNSIVDMAATAAAGLAAVGKKGLEMMRQPPKNLEHCFLYMPNSVQFDEGASWGATELGAMGNFAKQALRGEGDPGDAVKNLQGGAITKLATAVAVGAGAAAAGALGAIGMASLMPGLGGGLKAAGRFQENPYEEQLFNGIEFRTFSFEFAFAPSSEAEGEEIDSIINMFRLHSRPNFVGGVMGEGLYTFPNEFNIEFLMNENGAFEEHSWIPSIYNCVCTNVSTNYSPEGFWVALRDGRPVSYTLNLSFTETKKITQEDITSGY